MHLTALIVATMMEYEDKDDDRSLSSIKDFSQRSSASQLFSIDASLGTTSTNSLGGD